MADIWVTIPTAGRRTLTAALSSSGIPGDRTVLVDTVGNVPAHGCHRVVDLGEINIHRWWNVGLNHAAARGARYVAVLNDDVTVDETSLPLIVAAMGSTGAAIGSPGAPGHYTTPGPRALNGACWVLDLEAGLRPDEGYRWWYGDDDLDERARREHGGVVTVPVPFAHSHHAVETFARPELRALAEVDRERWTSAHR